MYTLHDYRIDVPTLKGEHDWSGVDPVKCLSAAIGCVFVLGTPCDGNQ